MRPFWDYIEATFETANIGLSELSRRTGISEPSLNSYRKRKTVPNLEYAHRICCALGVSMHLGVARERKDALLARAREAAEDEE